MFYKPIAQKYLFLISGLFFMSGAVVFYLWTSSFKTWEILGHLRVVSPLFLEIDFFLVLLFFCINIPVFKRVFAGIPIKILLSLGAILFSGLLITLFATPRDHKLYYDEDIYQNIAQNIALLRGAETGPKEGNGLIDFLKKFTGRAGMCNEGEIKNGNYQCFRLEYNKQPNSWPYLLSVAFRLFGVHELTSFHTNNFIYGLSILTVFCTGYLLFKDALSGIYGALIFSLIPEQMKWSNTTAAEPSAALFAGLTLLFILVYLQSREIKTLYLAAVTAVFAAQFRPESIMILVVIGLVILFWERGLFKRGDFYLLLSVAFLLIIPHLVHIFTVRNMNWGSDGTKLSLDFLTNNFKVNAMFYLENKEFPLFFTVFFALGISLKDGLIKDDFLLKEKSVLLTWFLLFWGIFLLFYAGSYEYGVDVRYSLLSFMPIALLAGQGASSMSHDMVREYDFKYADYILIPVIIVTFLSFLPGVKAIPLKARAPRADHHYAKIMARALSTDSLILTHNPGMFLLWGKNAAQGSLATERPEELKKLFNRYPGGLYFHYNFWCNVPDRTQNLFCTNILSRFKATRKMLFEEKDLNYRYMLYKIEMK